MERNGFLAYYNADMKQTPIKDFIGKYCRIILINGYFYTGYVVALVKNQILFIDKIKGNMKFNIDNIFVIGSSKKKENKNGWISINKRK